MKSLVLAHPFITACIAIIGAVALFKKLHKSTEELVKSSNELKDSFNDFESQTRDNIETLRELSTEFERLKKGVDRYGNNVSLTADQYERYKEIVEDVVGMSPSLIEGYDKENGYLVDKNGLLERAIELQEKEYRQELRRMTTTSKLSDAMAGSVATYSDLISGDALTTDNSFNGSIYRLFRINDRDDIAKGNKAGEAPYLARKILEALHVEDVDKELLKFFNEYDYWQSNWFWDEYVDRIAADINSGHSAIVASINYDEAGFESRSSFEAAVSDAENAAQAYIDVQDELAQANKGVSDQLMLVAESNDKYAELGAGARQIVSDFVNTFGVEQVSRDGFLSWKVIDDDAVTAAKVDIDNFVEKITPEIQNAIDDLYSQDFSAMTGDKIADTLPKAEGLITKIADALELTDEQVNKIRIKLGLAFNLTADDGTIINNREDMVDYLSNKIQPIIGENMDKEFEVGNVNLTLRPKVTGQAMIDAGWDEDPHSYGTVLSSTFDIKDANNNTVIVHATPILPDGTVLSPGELADYIEGELAGATDILNTDQEKRGIVLAVDTNVELNSDGSVSDDAWEKADRWDAALHEIQDQYYNTARLLNNLTGEQLNKLFSIPQEELAKYSSWNEILNSIAASEAPDTVSSLKAALAGLSDETTVLRDAMAKLGDSEFMDWLQGADGKWENLKSLLDKFPNLRDELDAYVAAVEAGEDPQKAFIMLQRAMNAAIADFNTDAIYDGINDVVSACDTYGASSNQVLQAVQNLDRLIPGLVDKLYTEENGHLTVASGANFSAAAIYNAARETIEMEKTAAQAKFDNLVNEFNRIGSAALGAAGTAAIALGQISPAKLMSGDGSAFTKHIDTLLASLNSAYDRFQRSENKAGKTSNSSEKVYVPDIDPLYRYLQAVEDINDRLDRIDIDGKLLDEDDFDGKNKLIEERIKKLEELKAALHELNNARDVEIAASVDKLNGYGDFQAAYNAKSGQAIIGNMDALKGLTGDTAKAAEELISNIESGSKAAISTSNEYMEALAEQNNLLKEQKDLQKSITDDRIERLKNKISLSENQQGVLEDRLHQQGAIHKLKAQIGWLEEIQGIAHEKAEEIRAEYRRAHNGDEMGNDDPLLQDWIEQYWDAADQIKEKRREIADEALAPIDEYIEKADALNWWDNIDVTKVDMLRSKLELIRGMLEDGYLTAAEFKELNDEIAKEIYQEQLDAMNTIIDKTKEMIKLEVEKRVEALESEVDDHQKITDSIKERLAALREENDYHKSVAQKTKEIAELTQRINTLNLSSDRRDIAERKKLEEELVELQSDLADMQADHAYDAQVDALDKSHEAFEQSKQDEIDAVKATIDTEGKLYAAAIERIDKGWDQLYTDLISINDLYQDGIDGEDSITSAWKTAADAAKDYQSVLQAIQGVEKENVTNIGNQNLVGQAEVNDPSATSHVLGAKAVDRYGTDVDQQETLANIHAAMKANSIAWHTANPGRREELHQKNEAMAKEASDLLSLAGHRLVFNPADGAWYIDKIGGERFYDVYHKGGIVGSNEEFAKVEDGELIVPKEHVKPTMMMLEWGNSLASKARGLFSGDKLAPYAMSAAINGTPLANASGAIVNNNAPSFAPNIQVEVKYDSSASSADAKRFGENISAGMIEAFRRKGIGAGATPLLTGI